MQPWELTLEITGDKNVKIYKDDVQLRIHTAIVDLSMSEYVSEVWKLWRLQQKESVWVLCTALASAISVRVLQPNTSLHFCWRPKKLWESWIFFTLPRAFTDHPASLPAAVDQQSPLLNHPRNPWVGYWWIAQRNKYFMLNKNIVITPINKSEANSQTKPQVNPYKPYKSNPKKEGEFGLWAVTFKE